MIKITIVGKLPTLNEYIKKERSNKFAGAGMKKRATEYVGKQLLAYKSLKLELPVFFRFDWYTKNKKTGPDNIAFAKKFILDAMVQVGILKNDSWKSIEGFEDNFLLNDEEKVDIIL